MDTLVKLSIIGAGGFTGAVLRFLISSWVQARSGSVIFPFGTLSVNMLGCFIIGLLSWLVETRSLFTTETRSFVLIGLLGAFTTFSTFGLETLNLIRDSRMDLAAMNAVGQVVVGIGLVWLGRVVAAVIW